MTESNYLAGGGSYQELGGGRYYRVLRGDVSMSFHPSRSWELMTSVGFGYSQSFDSQFDRSNSEITELGAGARYTLIDSDFSLFTEFIFLFPLNKIDPATDASLTGEGVMVLQPGLWSTVNIWALQAYAFVGYRYQDEDRASLLPWRLGLQAIDSSWIGGAEVNGAQKISDDKDSANIGPRTTVTTRVNGSSLRYYSVNPTWMAARAWTGWKGQAFDLRLGIEQTLDGENTAHGLSVFVNLKLPWYFGSSPQELSPSGFQDDIPPSRFRERRGDQFQPAEQKYDEELFEQSNPLPQKKRTGRKARPRPKAKPKPKAAPPPNVDKMLDDTQKALENF